MLEQMLTNQTQLTAIVSRHDEQYHQQQKFNQQQEEINKGMIHELKNMNDKVEGIGGRVHELEGYLTPHKKEAIDAVVHHFFPRDNAPPTPAGGMTTTPVISFDYRRRLSAGLSSGSTGKIDRLTPKALVFKNDDCDVDDDDDDDEDNHESSRYDDDNGVNSMYVTLSVYRLELFLLLWFH